MSVVARPKSAALGWGLAALALAPAGAVVSGFRASLGEPAGGWWIGVALLGVAFGVVAIATGRAARDVPAGRAGMWLGIAAMALAAVGPAFWLLVQLAPSADQLRATDANPLLGPVGFAVAFLVGMIAFFSPCILPLLPGYLTFVSGLSGEELETDKARSRVVTGALLFTLGFATVFTLLGASASLLGGFVNRNAVAFNRIAGGVVILMGLAFITPQLVRFMERERRPFMSRVRPGLGGAFPLGLAFAVGWTPCVGPGLGAMLTFGARTEQVGRGALLLFFFSLGFGVWFVLAALGMRRALGASGWLRRHARALQIVGGLFMVALGIMLVTDYWYSLIGPLRTMIERFAPPV